MTIEAISVFFRMRGKRCQFLIARPASLTRAGFVQRFQDTMATVQIRRVEKFFGTSHIIRGVDIDIQDGQFTVLVGPSGCGKSTLLRMIAGLEEISKGEVLIGGRVVNAMLPKERDIAMVFQNYALYPHMTVAENIGFHLKIKKRPKAEIKQRVLEAAKLLDLEPYLDRKPARLSGGLGQWPRTHSE